MSQPVSLGAPVRVAGTAAGTAFYGPGRPTNLYSVVVPANLTGTLSFYEGSVAADVAAGNLKFTVPNTVGTIPTSLRVNATFRKGLIVTTGGTTDACIVVE